MPAEELDIPESLCAVADNGMAVMKLCPAGPTSVLPCVLRSAHSFVLVGKGVLCLEINRIPCRLEANCMIDFPGPNEIRVISASPDLEASLLLMSTSCVSVMFKERPPFPFSYVLRLRSEPLYQIDQEVMQLLITKLEYLERILRNQEYLFRMEALKYELWSFSMEVANHAPCFRKEVAQADNNRKDDIYLQFTELVSEHVREERTVKFYADALCISVQHLARVVKEASGETVHYWVSHVLLSEITRLLKDAERSVMQVADELNFADQSSLSKFFKKHTGMSPGQYRKKNNRPGTLS